MSAVEVAVPASTGGTGVRGLVARHPLLSFLLVFNTLGQAAAFSPLVLREQAGIHLNSEVVLAVTCILLILGPALVAVRLSRGAAGLRALLRDVLRFDVRARWWVLPLLVVPAVDLALSFHTPAGGWDIGPVLSSYVTAFLPALAWNFLSTNWWEETAWTGFFQRTLDHRFTPIVAVLITTPFFTLEHISLVFDDAQLGGGLPQLAVLAVVIFFWRCFASWLYVRTGSLAVVGLFHAATNASGALAGDLDLAGVGGLSLLLPGVVVLVLTRGRLGRPRAGTEER